MDILSGELRRYRVKKYHTVNRSRYVVQSLAAMDMQSLPNRLLERCISSNSGLANYMGKLMTLQTSGDLLNIVYHDLKKHFLFPKIIQDKKNDASAISYKEQGNKHFGSGNYVKALEAFTSSVATSQTPSVRAVAYANRSACLFRLNRHQECIVDIERALANNYPDELKEKIIKRRQQAEKLQKPMEKYYEEIPKIPDSHKNPLIQCASNCIKIECNEEYGRHIIATRDIEIDELIAVEKPFACVLTKEQLIHCHNCMELCYNLIPCDSCTQALFCSEACKDQAQIYHKYECLISLTLIKAEIDYILFAVRVALLAKGEYDQLESYHFDTSQYYRSDRYKEIHCLQGKPLRKPVFNHKLFRETVFIAAIFHWLETTDFFNNDNIKDHFKEVMLWQMQIIPRNGIGVYEYAQDSEKHGYTTTHFVNAIFSFASLFNHSCCRYLDRYAYGSTVVFRTNNKIKKGEQCFVNYGPHYDGFPKSDRQLELNKNYFFTCKCIACEKDWKGRIADFAKVMNLAKGSRKLRNMQEKLVEADLEFAKKMLPVFLNKLKRCEHKEPWGDALCLKISISLCYNTMGNKRRM